MAPPTEGAPDKRAARIARRLEADIIRRGWPVGESLGSEQALQQRYDVSRSVLREAVRLVEHHRVARMRRGPNGGLFVTVPDAAPATRAVVIYLEYLGITVDELLDARLLLEPLASGLAAERIDESGIERLRGILTARGPQPMHDEFHVVLGELSGNPVLALFLDVLTRLTARYAGDTGHASPHEAGAAIARLTADHRTIVEAVTAGDSARAKTLTAEHVQTVTGWLRDYVRTGRQRATPPPARTAEAAKRAEVLAAVIHDDIATGGWLTGSVFGTETELVDRYTVSRSVLRESVRLLEYHTVARMRRGPGGGLIVTEPQPGASVDTIALYLDYRRPSRDDLRLVRDAIEVSSVAKVVNRRSDQEVATFVAAHRQTAEDTGTPRDPLEAGPMEYDFHAGLTDLAGNRVHQLFLRILMELSLRHWAGTMSPMPEAQHLADAHHAHSRIIDAILDGDTGMAQHRSRRHLEALSGWWL
jgi:DNA-binding FadR family transcriptional regulator